MMTRCISVPRSSLTCHAVPAEETPGSPVSSLVFDCRDHVVVYQPVWGLWGNLSFLGRLGDYHGHQVEFRDHVNELPAIAGGVESPVALHLPRPPEVAVACWTEIGRASCRE